MKDVVPSPAAKAIIHLTRSEAPEDRRFVVDSINVTSSEMTLTLSKLKTRSFANAVNPEIVHAVLTHMGERPGQLVSFPDLEIVSDDLVARGLRVFTRQSPDGEVRAAVHVERIFSSWYSLLQPENRPRTIEDFSDYVAVRALFDVVLPCLNVASLSPTLWGDDGHKMTALSSRIGEAVADLGFYSELIMRHIREKEDRRRGGSSPAVPYLDCADP
ncbi:hypothetical protein [Psychromarinibacter halotolerans]|uniref:Uncharacterized protein n=1 Tax=Psychromarinibacter halotolerans TaxID=1775175 RepID=A0ABV7GS91_9RHOB|nr:hypothetical protein [Psychromarinibacter halotolerans]MDF0596796.1 hypothetical protein [Psychromarinibacter halotolerans]